MCGILGQINFNHQSYLLPCLNMLKHRGPDGQGEWKNDQENIYLGHTRLAILDRSSAGCQPMSDSGGQFTITFNGEIYNHLELRTLLPEFNWRGNSDTETIVELFANWGVEIIPLLKGMFAFAINDSKNKSLLLVRDRFGIKPLWIKSSSDSCTFASEIRPLIQMDEKIEFKEMALSEYIGFGRFPNTGEIFENISSLPAGTWMLFENNNPVKQENWWVQNTFPKNKVKNRQTVIKTVKSLLTKAVEEHLISDVGVGAFLSGGIDSSIISLIAGRTLGKNLKTFTVGFPKDNTEFDERAIAKEVAMRIGSEHNEIEVNDDKCVEYIKEAVHKLDLPSVDALNTYIVSKAVSDTGLKVALAGVGGDELFGGYPSFNDVPKLAFLNVLGSTINKKLIRFLPPKFKEKLEGLNKFDALELTVARRRFVSNSYLNRVGLTSVNPEIHLPDIELDNMGIISWGEMQGYMIPMLLRDSDQTSMAVGLEVRVPFLDHQLVEYVLQIPKKLKKGKGVKPLIVDAFRGELPDAVFNRPKQGFALPMDRWIREPLAEFTNIGIRNAADFFKTNEPFNIQLKFDQRKIHWTRLWCWCVLGHWLASQQNKTFSCNI